MKLKLIFVILFVLQTNSYSQMVIGGLENVEMMSTLLRSDSDLSKDVEGSPYLKKEFTQGFIGNISQPVLLRYNSFKDEYEYKSVSDSIFIIPKKTELNPVVTLGKKAFFTNYFSENGEKSSGYLIEVYSKKIKIFKNEKIILIPAEQPKNGYDSYKPARFKITNPKYYIQLNEDVVPFPKNKKALINLFPYKENEIIDFLKINKINLSKEEDMKKLVTFLETI